MRGASARPVMIAACLLVQIACAPIRTPTRAQLTPDGYSGSEYFETIDGLSRRMGLKPLRSSAIRPGDLEARLWVGFGIGPLKGFAMRRMAGRWSALAMIQQPSQRPRLANVPKSTDWATLWKRLEDGGFRTIRDESQIPHCTPPVNDGTGYVIEIAEAGLYRTYELDNPEVRRSEDGDRFLRLLPYVYRAFGMPIYVGQFELPDGEIQTASSVSSELPEEPITAESASWPWIPQAGEAVGGAPGLRVSPRDAVLHGLTLQTPGCQTLPLPYRYFDVSEQVAVELIIDPRGSVLAARALSGPGSLRVLSVDSALRWTFTPLLAGKQNWSTVLAINYRREWARFSWLRQ